MTDTSEIYRAINELRMDLSGRIERLDNDVSNQITRIETSWNARFDTHHIDHMREEDKHNSKVRWAVTTVVAVMIALGSNGVTIYLALTDAI
jgi:hypothetical protein